MPDVARTHTHTQTDIHGYTGTTQTLNMYVATRGCSLLYIHTHFAVSGANLRFRIILVVCVRATNTLWP